MVDALAVIDKPSGMTSHDVIGRCRRLFGQKRIGHAGTLDPDATGVLIVAFGRATRLLQFMSGLPKSYSAEVVLGVATSTLDAAGEVTGRWDQSHVTLEDARSAAVAFTGCISQVPPMVSAVKVGGRRLHELARAGIEVDRPARQVTVTRFDVDLAAARPSPEGPSDPQGGGGTEPIGGAGGGPVLSVRIDCSSGTYIRVLAADLGAALGGGAHVRQLRRLAVGPWTEEVATPLDSLEERHLLPPSAAVPWLERICVGADVATDVGHGKVLDASSLGASGSGPWAVVGPAGDLLAVYETHGPGRAKPTVVLVGSDSESPRR